MESKMDIGLIGLAVMGQNLVLNMNDHGYDVAVYNRTVGKVDEFLKGNARGTRVAGARTLVELVRMLKSPRRVMLMVKAGHPVDEFIQQLLVHMEPGDIIIDGGNSNYEDTRRRVAQVESRGILYIGAGVSGGEHGARFGPSIMPGGSVEAWPLVRPLFQAVAAKVDGGVPCCNWVGEDGSGHFVKMVHNGIEYGDMQLISEAYHFMKAGLGMTADQMSEVFGHWNQGKLNSYLIEITRDILSFREGDGTALVEKILDTAGQKGTGRWTVVAALDMGVPLTLIGEAVLARALSGLKEERVEASQVLSGPRVGASAIGETELVKDLQEALYASKIVSYTQGFHLLRAAATEYGWGLDFGEIAMMWRGGCIIRSAFLGKIKEAFDKNPHLKNLLLDSYFKQQLESAQESWRRIISQAVSWGIPVPATSSALSFYDGYRQARLPANLIQAQRDYFGAHMYERVDRTKGQIFHTAWTEQS